jgi:hypothetical protein
MPQNQEIMLSCFRVLNALIIFVCKKDHERRSSKSSSPLAISTELRGTEESRGRFVFNEYHLQSS